MPIALLWASIATLAIQPLSGLQQNVQNVQPPLLEPFLAQTRGRQTLTEVSRYPLGVRSMQWVENQTRHVDLRDYTGPTDVTGIVTHAGKHALDYIDSATMLGLALQRHLPEVPRFAIVIEGMPAEFQTQLMNAGWNLVKVEDWGEEHIGGNAAANFLGRWGDSFEKINVWRFPLDRVLFLDSDTYIFDGKIRDILDMKLEPGQIAMTKDGCKPEYNSGMMLFKPDLSVFGDLMRTIALHSGGSRDILDQTIINKEYDGKIVTMDKRYNCIDYQADPRCPLSCGQDTIIAHFTGNPKPTREGVRNVERVRSLNGSLACKGTNLGGCQLWPRYYCDMKKNAHLMSKLLRRTLNQTGPCLWPATDESA